jgi:dolichol-phosphate mannosyltransferase
MRAVVIDVPMDPIYGDEVSNLSAMKSIFEFTRKHLRNYFKRIFYNYFLREFSLATLNLTLGFTLFTFGIIFGLENWINSIRTGIPTGTGALILVAMSVLSGLQMLLSFVSYDISHEPKNTLNSRL